MDERLSEGKLVLIPQTPSIMTLISTSTSTSTSPNLTSNFTSTNTNNSTAIPDSSHLPASATPTPSTEKRDPFRALIRPFLRRGHTLESLKESLKLSLSKHHPQSSSSNSGLPSSSSSDQLQFPHQSHPSSPLKPDHHSNRAFKVTNRPSHKLSITGSNSALRQSVGSSNSHDHLHRPPSSVSLCSKSKKHSPSVSSSQPNPSPLQNLFHPPLPASHSNPLTTNHHPLTAEPASIPSPLSTNYPILPSHSPVLSASALASSIHSLLTQPALATLTQLAPAQLLSGVHSGCFTSSDAFRVLNDYDFTHSDDENPAGPPYPTTSSPLADHSLDPSKTHPKVNLNQARRLPTTIEQLSASSIALPITSISSIWRLLNCIEWINLKERELLTQPPSRAPQTRFNSYSSHASSNTHPQGQSDARGTSSRAADESSFDLANVLQHVGDILSAITSDSDVEMVFYHIFYPPKLESTEIEDQHPTINGVPDLTPSPSLTPSHKTSPSGDSLNSASSDRPPDSSHVHVGDGADGEGGLREISVKADEKGLIIGLTCLLRQILYRAKRSSTIEVGLHLTPLYKKHHTFPDSNTSTPSQAVQDSQDQTAAPDDREAETPTDPVHSSKPSSWKCVFEVSLTPPVAPKTAIATASPPPKANPASEPLTQPPPIITKTAAEQPIDSESPTSPTLARLRMSSNLSSELPLCPEESLSKLIFERSLGMKLSTGRLTRSGHSWKVIGIFETGIDRESAAVHGTSTNSMAPTAQLTPHTSSQRKPVVNSAREPTVSDLTFVPIFSLVA